MKLFSHLSTFEKQKADFHGMNSQAALAYCQGLHSGRRAFVIGNGPSLKVEDLDMLQGEVTFAANRIYLAYEQTNWRPTYWCCTDSLVAETNQSKIQQLQHIKFGAFSVEESLGNHPNTYIVDGPQWNADQQKRYSSLNLLDGIHPGVSVVMFMIKLAFWMGIPLIYLLGVDFSFTVPKGSGTKARVHGNKVILSKGEANHFHPDYRAPGEKWTFPKLNEQEEEFAMMRWKADNSGRKIFNASRATKLTVFDRVDLDQVIGTI